MTRPADNSEAHRHRCEVRMCLRNGRAWFEAYVKGTAESKGVVDKRGKEAARRLWDDVRIQAAAGNTGAPGVWMDEQPISLTR